MIDNCWNQGPKETVDYSDYNLGRVNEFEKMYAHPPPGFSEVDKGSDEGSAIFVSFNPSSFKFMKQITNF
jgi:hypothetical protein